MTYARIQEDMITIGDPPELLDPEDTTADGRWWDLRMHEYTLQEWEEDIIGPHGWKPVVTTERPPDTAEVTYDYSIELIDGIPTEVWTERPWSEEELLVEEKEVNVATMTVESEEAVDKLVLVVENLNVITDMTNAAINQNAAAVIKDLAREVKTVARQVNREARMTSGKTESTFTGTEEV